MIKEGHIEKYDLILTIKSPLFIGSGNKIGKKQYIFNQRDKIATILNEERFMSLIISKKLVNSYETFILRSNDPLFRFLSDNNVNQNEINYMTDYKVSAGDALMDERPPMAIDQFMRDSYYNTYIPGSSIKGALRTVVLLKYKNKELEGVSISDSLPLKHSDMVLCGKHDVSVNGKVNQINMVRECIKPNTKVEFSLTIDTKIANNLGIELLKSAISYFGEYYKETFKSKFKDADITAMEDYKGVLILGGGSGFFSKTTVYKNRGYDEGLKFVAKFMQEKFRNGHHEKDIGIGISPHMLKYTKYQNKFYHYGICKVDIL